MKPAFGGNPYWSIVFTLLYAYSQAADAGVVPDIPGFPGRGRTPDRLPNREDPRRRDDDSEDEDEEPLPEPTVNSALGAILYDEYRREYDDGYTGLDEGFQDPVNLRLFIRTREQCRVYPREIDTSANASDDADAYSLIGGIRVPYGIPCSLRYIDVQAAYARGSVMIKDGGFAEGGEAHIYLIYTRRTYASGEALMAHILPSGSLNPDYDDGRTFIVARVRHYIRPLVNTTYQKDRLSLPFELYAVNHRRFNYSESIDPYDLDDPYDGRIYLLVHVVSYDGTGDWDFHARSQVYFTPSPRDAQLNI